MAETIVLSFSRQECPTSYGNLSPLRIQQVRNFAPEQGSSIVGKAA